jgi:hypothetical protein
MKEFARIETVDGVNVLCRKINDSDGSISKEEYIAVICGFIVPARPTMAEAIALAKIVAQGI